MKKKLCIIFVLLITCFAVLTGCSNFKKYSGTYVQDDTISIRAFCLKSDGTFEYFRIRKTDVNTKERQAFGTWKYYTYESNGWETESFHFIFDEESTFIPHDGTLEEKAVYENKTIFLNGRGKFIKINTTLEKYISSQN